MKVRIISSMIGLVLLFVVFVFFDTVLTNLVIAFICALAVYELLTAGAENERIIINEALEICRTYADEKAVAFVNGVLGKAADAVGSTRA